MVFRLGSPLPPVSPRSDQGLQSPMRNVPPSPLREPEAVERQDSGPVSHYPVRSNEHPCGLRPGTPTSRQRLASDQCEVVSYPVCVRTKRRREVAEDAREGPQFRVRDPSDRLLPSRASERQLRSRWSLGLPNPWRFLLLGYGGPMLLHLPALAIAWAPGGAERQMGRQLL